MKVEPGFALKIQCDECPWRRDVPAGRFTPERFEALADSCRQRFPPPAMFACHKTPESKEQACVGYLLLNGKNNLAVRIAAAQGRIAQLLRASLSSYQTTDQRAAMRGVLGDAAGLCDAMQKEVLAQNTRPGHLSSKAVRDVAAAFKRCGDEIWRMREMVKISR